MTRAAQSKALLVLLTVLVGSIGPWGAGVLARPDPGVPVRLAAFYHPPKELPPNGPAPPLGAAILTRGDESYRDGLRSGGFRGPILQYLLANEASGPPGLRSSSDPCGPYPYYPNNASGIAGDFCSALHGDERNFLHNGRGERLYTVQWWRAGRHGNLAVLYAMNPSAPGWRDYLMRKVRENVRELGYDGIFLDNLDLTANRVLYAFTNSGWDVRELGSHDQYEATNAAHRTAVLGLLAELRHQLPRVTLWANLTAAEGKPVDWEPFLPYLDGVMEEFFATEWGGKLPTHAEWEVQLRNAERAQERGKALIAVGQGERADVHRMRFALASYLLVAHGIAYFRYAHASAYAETWLYDDYRVRLGSPLTDRYEQDGIWRRDFLCGYVTVDPRRYEAAIVSDLRSPNCI